MPIVCLIYEQFQIVREKFCLPSDLGGRRFTSYETEGHKQMLNQAETHRSREMPGVFTVLEAAHFLRLSKSTVDRMLRRGTLSRVKIGARTLVLRREVEALLTAGGETT